MDTHRAMVSADIFLFGIMARVMLQLLVGALLAAVCHGDTLQIMYPYNGAVVASALELDIGEDILLAIPGWYRGDGASPRTDGAQRGALRAPPAV